jgi:hypothetical protein
MKRKLSWESIRVYTCYAKAKA